VRRDATLESNDYQNNGSARYYTASPFHRARPRPRGSRSTADFFQYLLNVKTSVPRGVRYHANPTVGIN
jgi:hypothetical protein